MEITELSWGTIIGIDTTASWYSMHPWLREGFKVEEKSDLWYVPIKLKLKTCTVPTTCVTHLSEKETA